MTRRNSIYIALLAFISLGLLINAAVWPAGPPDSYTVNDMVQMVGIITLFARWQIEDADKRAVRRSSSARIATVVFAPAGLAIYLYQTHSWKTATVNLFTFMGGFLLVAILTIMLGDWLVAQGFFPPSFLRDL